MILILIRGYEMDKLTKNEIIIYQTEDGKTKIDVQMENETVWLTQAQMAELFGTGVDNINVHLKNIYDSEELDKGSTIEEISIVQKEGNREVKRSILCYNLDVIISVGYRVNSKRATMFRRLSCNIFA